MNLRGMMENVMYGLRRLLYGRYGFDQLSWGLFGLAMLSALVAGFAGIEWLMLVYYVLFFICVFRAMSRDIYKRQRENRWLLSKTRPITGWLRLRRRMLRERKTFKYLKCGACGQWLRVPRGKGKINVSCAKCGGLTIKTV